MSNASLASIVVSLAVLALILYRQRQRRVVTTALTMPAALTVAGLAGLAGTGQGRSLSTGGVAALLVLLALDAVALGAVRAYTVRVWREDEFGRWLRQGTWITLGLWVLGAGVHAAADALVHLGSASLLLYLGVTYGAQRLVLRRRVAKLAER